MFHCPWPSWFLWEKSGVVEPLSPHRGKKQQQTHRRGGVPLTLSDCGPQTRNRLGTFSVHTRYVCLSFQLPWVQTRRGWKTKENVWVGGTRHLGRASSTSLLPLTVRGPQRATAWALSQGSFHSVGDRVERAHSVSIPIPFSYLPSLTHFKFYPCRDSVQLINQCILWL